MSELDTAYCRLCAKPKANNELVNLQTDKGRRQKAMEKLKRITVTLSDLESSKDDLPKTVCFSCLDELDNASDFVIDMKECYQRIDMLRTYMPLRAQCRLCGVVLCAEQNTNLTRHLHQAHWTDPRVRGVQRRGRRSADNLVRDYLLHPRSRSRSPVTRNPSHRKLLND